MYVKLFGKFQISHEKNQLSGEDLHSDRILKLLVYLLLHRDYAISFQELADALWEDDETDNPVGALKNLIYRLRGILNTNFGVQEYIITSRGSYLWNPEIMVEMDVEAFERYYDGGKKEEDFEQAIYCFEQACDLYQGNFVPQISDRHWAVTLTAYYHSRFLSCVEVVCRYYMEKSRFEQVERLCSRAIRYGNVDETLYCMLIRGFIAQNKRKLALEQYELAKKQLRDVLDVSQSKELEELHQEILKMKEENQTKDIHSVSSEMREKQPSGVFFCSYQVFREIYRLEARKSARSQDMEFIVLLTLTRTSDFSASRHGNTEAVFEGAMSQMRETLRETLRIGDVASQNSDKQFVLLLSQCTKEGSLAVLERIQANFEQKEGMGSFRVLAESEEVSEQRSKLLVWED